MKSLAAQIARATDDIAGKITAIRNVAREIDSVESRFANLDDRLTRFQAAAAEFLTGFAAGFR